VGVAEALGQSPTGLDRDDFIVVPLGAMRGRLVKSSSGSVGMLMISVVDAESVEQVKAEVTAALRDRHHIRPDDPADFRVLDQAQLVETMSKSTEILTMVLVALASISLLVGGVGVMNIMLVSVAERRREIGVCLAIGAEGGQVAMQFLVESVVLALGGGLLGAALGVAASWIIPALLGWSAHVSVSAIILGLLTSMLTGVLFGFFPAMRASRLDPVEAIRGS
jgi:putative ABC transport system permease protein